jgi:diamine N-acetyltransferase
MELSIAKATVNDISSIQSIAQETWPNTYGAILSATQLEFMMDMMYSDTSLTQQIQGKQLFYMVTALNKTIAFFAIEHHYQNEAVTRIHKIYLLPETHGKGIGKQLIDCIATLASEHDSKKLSLNVNRYNKALHFYQKIGFTIIKEEDIEIGNGYLMEDYCMEKTI